MIVIIHRSTFIRQSVSILKYDQGIEGNKKGANIIAPELIK